MISDDDRPVGMIQRYRIADEPEWWPAFDGICDVSNAAGIDYLIGVLDVGGRGLGSAVIAAFSPMVFEWRPVDSIVVTVQQGEHRVLADPGEGRLPADLVGRAQLARPGRAGAREPLGERVSRHF